MQAVHFLVNTVFDLLVWVVLVRVWLQLARADFYNPFSQFVVKVTNPPLIPLRKVIPKVGNLDVAAVLFAYVLLIAKIVVLFLIHKWNFSVQFLILAAGRGFLAAVFDVLFWILVIRAILSWVSQGYNPIEAVMHQLTEPLLAPIRRIIPPIGGLDLSILVLLIALQFLQKLI